MKKLLLTIVTLLFLVTSVYAFESFTIETKAKAYKKVTIEYFAQDYEQVHDSTVTIWYDKDGVEIHRKVVKGCSNRKGTGYGLLIESDPIWDSLSTTLEWHMDITTDCDSLMPAYYDNKDLLDLYRLQEDVRDNLESF